MKLQFLPKYERTAFALEDCIDKVRRVLKKPKQITTEVSNREFWPEMTSSIRLKTWQKDLQAFNSRNIEFYALK